MAPKSKNRREAPASGRSVLRPIGIGIAAAVAFFLLAGWISLAPYLVVPLLIGGYVGLIISKPAVAAATAAGSSLSGGLLALAFYTPERVVKLVNGLPERWNQDVPRGLYTDLVLPIAEAARWNMGSALLGVLVCAAAAAGISWLASYTGKASRVRAATAWILALLLSASFLATATQTSAGLRQGLSVEPQNGQYAFDAMDTVKTIYLMKAGIPYYRAFVEGAAGDARGAGNWVRDGKFIAVWPTPAYIRQPMIFEMWARMGKTPSGVISWSIFLSALALIAIFAGFYRLLGTRALMVSFALYPWLLAHSATINALFPEWWTGLAGIFAVSLMAAGLSPLALLLLLFGAFARFTGLAFLGIVTASALILLLRKEDRRATLIVAGVGVACLAAFLVMWTRHVGIAAQYIGAEAAAAPRYTLEGLASRPLLERLLVPSAYYMYAYGFGLWPAWLFAPGMAGLAITFRRRGLAQLSLVGYLLAWLIYLLALGPSSTYWAQIFTGVIVIGTGTLLAEIDKFPSNARDAWAGLIEMLPSRRRLSDS